MLILTRKVGEVITIGDAVRIKVVAVGEGQVKIGIDAPKELKIYRAELYEQIQQQNRKATMTNRTSAARIAGLFSGTSKPPPSSSGQ